MIDNTDPAYEERVIASLPKRLQVFMALRTLEGYKFKCGSLTQVGNRWWTVDGPNAKHIAGVGGLQLEDVLLRLERTMSAKIGKHA